MKTSNDTSGFKLYEIMKVSTEADILSYLVPEKFSSVIGQKKINCVKSLSKLECVFLHVSDTNRMKYSFCCSQ